jgi:hypothetical protein
MRSQVPGRTRAHRRLLAAWRLAIAIWLVLWLWPVSFGITRLVEILLAVFIAGGALVIWWNRRAVRWSVLVTVILLLAVILLPGRAPSEVSLRQRYVHELKRFYGARYVWGGENRFGIDCSGLVRRALIRGLWKEGVFTANPRLIRKSGRIWWQDASAKALAEEIHGQTRSLGTVESLRSIEPERLALGDLAVSADGVHVLAFIGDGKWIEADPDLGRVTILPTANPNDESNVWLDVPMTILRWRILETLLKR